jgi:hypothetical protein
MWIICLVSQYQRERSDSSSVAFCTSFGKRRISASTRSNKEPKLRSGAEMFGIKRISASQKHYTCMTRNALSVLCFVLGTLLHFYLAVLASNRWHPKGVPQNTERPNLSTSLRVIWCSGRQLPYTASSKAMALALARHIAMPCMLFSNVLWSAKRTLWQTPLLVDKSSVDLQTHPCPVLHSSYGSYWGILWLYEGSWRIAMLVLNTWGISSWTFYKVLDKDAWGGEFARQSLHKMSSNALLERKHEFLKQQIHLKIWDKMELWTINSFYIFSLTLLVSSNLIAKNI